MKLIKKPFSRKWFLGPWNSSSPIEIGVFKVKKDRLHCHREIYEYYILTKGTMTLFIEGKEIKMEANQVCMLEPGEKHKVKTYSKGVECFLIKFPHLPNDKKVLE